MRRWTTNDEGETFALGRELQSQLGSDAIVLLTGDLGSGKTVLTRGIATGLGVDPSEVQSPTFTLIREHSGPGGRLVHVDLYRLEPEDLPSLGLDEWLGARAVKVVEWAERLPTGTEADLRLAMRRTGTRGQREIREIRSPE